jgi:hypothetical protein
MSLQGRKPSARTYPPSCQFTHNNPATRENARTLRVYQRGLVAQRGGGNQGVVGAHRCARSLQIGAQACGDGGRPQRNSCSTMAGTPNSAGRSACNCGTTAGSPLK